MEPVPENENISSTPYNKELAKSLVELNFVGSLGRK